jgi:hypothetical protein
MNPGWSSEVAGLLDSFEVLRGLVVGEAVPAGIGVEERIISLTPDQLGLDGKLARGEDWDLFCGGLLYSANVLGKAHSIFQEANSSEGAYWHGMLHRREGDFSNALYWVRRAGRIPALAGMTNFSPQAFISDCAAAASRGSEPPHLLEIQRREWTALMDWSWRRLSVLG